MIMFCVGMAAPTDYDLAGFNYLEVWQCYWLLVKAALSSRRDLASLVSRVL
jgi:hypothetical protein